MRDDVPNTDRSVDQNTSSSFSSLTDTTRNTGRVLRGSPLGNHRVGPVPWSCHVWWCRVLPCCGCSMWLLPCLSSIVKMHPVRTAPFKIGFVFHDIFVFFFVVLLKLLSPFGGSTFAVRPLVNPHHPSPSHTYTCTTEMLQVTPMLSTKTLKENRHSS